MVRLPSQQRIHLAIDGCNSRVCSPILDQCAGFCPGLARMGTKGTRGVVRISMSCRGSVLAAVLLVLISPLADGQPLVDVPEFKVCYNYGCKQKDQVHLASAEWHEVLAVFATVADSAQQERQQIGQAIALMEQFVGRHTPTYRDRGRNPPTDAWPGQMDCIDESVNTTRYLHLFAAEGVLRWHQAGARVARAPFLFDLHWAGQLVERGTQKAYAVDSWYRDNGGLPYIQPLEQWRAKKPFKRLSASVPGNSGRGDPAWH